MYDGISRGYEVFTKSPVKYDDLHAHRLLAAGCAWLWQFVPVYQLLCQSLLVQHEVPTPGRCDHCELHAPARQLDHLPVTERCTRSVYASFNPNSILFSLRRSGGSLSSSFQLLKAIHHSNPPE